MTYRITDNQLKRSNQIAISQQLLRGTKTQHVEHCVHANCLLPITVATRYNVWTVFARLNAGIVGSSPTRGMGVCVRLFCVCAVLCAGSGLATDSSPVQGVLPTVYRILRNWNTGQGTLTMTKWPPVSKLPWQVTYCLSTRHGPGTRICTMLTVGMPLVGPDTASVGGTCL
jgi:hypothetical protein